MKLLAVLLVGNILTWSFYVDSKKTIQVNVPPTTQPLLPQKPKSLIQIEIGPKPKEYHFYNVPIKDIMRKIGTC